MKFDYKETQLQSISTSIIGFTGGELERKNNLTFEPVKDEGNYGVIVTNEEKIIINNQEQIFEITLIAYFECDEEIDDIQEVLDNPEYRSQLTLPILSESSLIISFITQKLFGVPMVVAPLETEDSSQSEE